MRFPTLSNPPSPIVALPNWLEGISIDRGYQQIISEYLPIRQEQLIGSLYGPTGRRPLLPEPQPTQVCYAVITVPPYTDRMPHAACRMPPSPTACVFHGLPLSRSGFQGLGVLVFRSISISTTRYRTAEVQESDEPG